MPSNVALGRSIELKAVKHLRSEGYTVHRTVRSTYQTSKRFGSHQNDIFGCIDLLAKRPGAPIRFIQVTCTAAIGKKIEDLSAVPWDDEFESVEVWRWVKGNSGVKGYFQIYSRAQDYVYHVGNRITPN